MTWIFRGYPNKCLDLKLVRTIVVKWYNLVAMKDHGCCHDLARGGDNNGKAGHRGEENEVDMFGVSDKPLKTPKSDTAASLK
ncbi:hypothetical protein EZV62_006257 [Acer yangbiense]|uniref:Uncharacterized protein n=1 Tax=Acer yangbiense TaxID=1000413 RepID=A0A5C7ISH2_9ROSI|nr:hypothetical protein EZV62_006257 [Acer yangbiense]